MMKTLNTPSEKQWVSRDEAFAYVSRELPIVSELAIGRWLANGVASHTRRGSTDRYSTQRLRELVECKRESYKNPLIHTSAIAVGSRVSDGTDRASWVSPIGSELSGAK